MNRLYEQLNGNAEDLKRRFHEICSEYGVWTAYDEGCNSFGLVLSINYNRISIRSPKYYLSTTGADLWVGDDEEDDFDEFVTKYLEEYSNLFKKVEDDYWERGLVLAQNHLLKFNNPEPWNNFVADEKAFQSALKRAFESDECKHIDFEEQYDLYGETMFDVSSSEDDDTLNISMTFEDRDSPDSWTTFKFDNDLNYTSTMNGETVTGKGYDDAAMQYVLRIANKYAEDETSKDYKPNLCKLIVYLNSDFYTKSSKRVVDTIEGMLENGGSNYTNYQAEDYVDENAAVWEEVEENDLKDVIEWLKTKKLKYEIVNL